MPRLLRYLALPTILLCATSAWAQPTITNVTPAYGGAGPNSPGSFTMTGTGFSTTQKQTRFVDANQADVLVGVSCSNATTCTASGVTPYRVAPGGVQTIQVYALVAGVISATHQSFIYYGEPSVSVTPNSATDYNVATGYTLSGGPFTSTGTGFPGTTSIYLANSIHDFASGCTSTSSCGDTAPSLTYDCCVPMGAYHIDVRTVGGNASPLFVYGPIPKSPATPTVTGVSASSGPSAGGNIVTITGTNFIPGTQVPVASFGLSRGTGFTFVSLGSFGSSNPASSVNCSSTTTCTAVVPAGAPGPVDIVVQTICGAGLSPCSGNARPSLSPSSTKSGLYAYPGIKVTPGGSQNIYTSESGDAATYKVSLDSPPTGNVHIAITVQGGSGVTPSTNSLDFTPQNWALPQTVTVTGVDDSGTPGNTTTYTLHNTASSADLNYDTLVGDQQVTNLDNDAKEYMISPQSGLFTTRTGGTASFTIRLLKAPTATVTVNVASSDPLAGVVTSPASLTFATTSGGVTGWDTARTVTVAGQNDGTPGKNRSYLILLTSTSGDGAYNFSSPNLYDVPITNIDILSAPAGLSLVRTGPGRAMARWSLAPGADYYKIKYSTTPGGAKTTLAASALINQTLPGLTINQQYYIVVSAVNSTGESNDSPEVPFKEYLPGAIDGFDGDLKTDMAYVTSAGVWHILNSTSGFLSGTTVSLGGAGYTPVPGDYDGDQRNDVAVYNTATGAWNILTSSSGFASSINVNWGGAGYLPVPGDYDGDGKTDPAVYRLSDGQWSAVLSSTNYTTTISKGWGGAGYVPVPGLDFDGDGKADLTIYSQSAGTWYVLKSSTNYTTTFTKAWGGIGYTLVPGDYDGDGKPDLGLYQRATGTWSILLSGAGYTTTISTSWGGVGYLPIPGDFDGDGRTDLGVFQQSTGNWFALLSTTNYTTTVSASGWGTSGDRILSSAIFVGGDDASRASDFDADGKAELTVYNTTSGGWSSLTSSSGYAGALNKNFGGSGYTAVPGDYDGDGKVDYAVYQISTGNWSVLLSSTNFTTALNKSAGGAGWNPVPGDYDGDGKTDFVAYNATTGQWFGLKSSTNYTTTVSISYGGTGYAAAPADFDGDGKTDIAVYQGSTGNWSVLLSSTNYTTSLSKNVGGAGYFAAQGDYDGDGKADFVVYNTATGLWYGLKSSSNYTTTVNVSWGGAGYVPVKGDFDGDGKADLATYVSTTGTFYILLSGSNYTTTLTKAFGGPGYIALPMYP